MAVDQKEQIIISLLRRRDEYLDNQKIIDLRMKDLDDLRINKSSYRPLAHTYYTILYLTQAIIVMSKDNKLRAALVDELKTYDPVITGNIFDRESRLLSAEDCFFKGLIITEDDDSPQRRIELKEIIGGRMDHTLEKSRRLDDDITLEMPQAIAVASRIKKENLKDLRTELYRSTNNPEFLGKDENLKDELGLTTVADLKVKQYLRMCDELSLSVDTEKGEEFYDQAMLICSRIAGEEPSEHTVGYLCDVAYAFTQVEKDSDKFKDLRNMIVNINRNNMVLQFLTKKAIDLTDRGYRNAMKEVKQDIAITDESIPVTRNEIVFAHLQLCVDKLGNLREILGDETEDVEFYIPGPLTAQPVVG